MFFTVGVPIVLFVCESIILNDQFDREYLTNMKIPINQKAPVISSGKIGINASITTVWSVLTTIGDWPEWQKDVTEAQINREVIEGAAFTWKAGELKFRSQIHTREFLKHFGWTGKTFGASAIHNWTFSEKDEQTQIVVEESLQGVFPMLFKKYFQKNLDSGILKNLSELK